MRRAATLAAVAAALAAAPLPAAAQAPSSGDLLSPLTRLAQQVSASLVGPLGLAIGIATLAGAAVSVAMGGARSFRWVMWVLIGVAILFGAPTIIQFIVGK